MNYGWAGHRRAGSGRVRLGAAWCGNVGLGAVRSGSARQGYE